MTNKIIPESELIINPDGTVFHIHLHPDQLTDNSKPAASDPTPRPTLTSPHARCATICAA